MLEQEGELATLTDAVEVAVYLVILTTCKEKTANCSCKLSICRLIFLWLIVRFLRTATVLNAILSV